MWMRKLVWLSLQIFSWLILLCLERSVGLPIFSTLIFLVFVSQFGRSIAMAAVSIVAGMVYAVVFGLPLYLGVLLIGVFSCSFVYTSNYFANQNRRLLFANLIICLLLWWLTKLPVNAVSLTYHSLTLTMCMVGVYLISGWKLQWRTLQISRRFQYHRS